MGEKMTGTTKSRLRKKIPEIILEAVSIIFAVLLALAVNEWREDRQNTKLAERAQQGVLKEIASNHTELVANRADNVTMLDSLNAGLARIKLEAGGRLSVEFSLSLLSSSAWKAAQATLAIHFLSFEWVERISKLYGLQELYERHQADLVGTIATAGGERTFEELVHREASDIKVALRSLLPESVAFNDGRGASLVQNLCKFFFKRLIQ